jgi:hypothetical protein
MCGSNSKGAWLIHVIFSIRQALVFQVLVSLSIPPEIFTNPAPDDIVFTQLEKIKT